MTNNDMHGSIQSLARGWNTWNVRSVCSHVLMPAGFAVNLGIREYRGGGCLMTPLVGRIGDDVEVVGPGSHAYDGSYTALELSWRDTKWRIETATNYTGEDWVARVTPLENQKKPASLIIESAMLWNRPGQLSRDGDKLVARLDKRTINVYATAAAIDDPWPGTGTPYLVVEASELVGVSTGVPRSLADISFIIDRRRREHDDRDRPAGEGRELYDAMQSCLAWDTIYEPTKDRVISPVSRLWSVDSGGYVLYCWDNYFAAFLASFECPDLACANAVAMTSEAVPEKFVPNMVCNAFSSRDRSQPPVGSAMVLEVIRRTGKTALAEELFDALLRWNQWWPANRDSDGLLCWGSTPYEPEVDNFWEVNGVNERFGGALESGLDNSPMYDDIPFDADRHQLKLADVGLTSLYVWDCDSLADLAELLGRIADAGELRARADGYRTALQSMWCEDFGLFLNRRTDTGEFSTRISPTNFYPLLARAATPQQAQRMIDEHLLNPDEFRGDWMLPSIARNDPAYPEQTYWRGRIWAPMNFLVYMGLRNYNLPAARKELADKSAALLLKEWREHRHVHENYCAETGEGCNRGNSDRFYHWGGLLGAIAIMETEQTNSTKGNNTCIYQ